MDTLIGGLFVISMLVLVAAFGYFIASGARVSADSAQESAIQAREAAHQPVAGGTATPPATGMMMDDIPSETKNPWPS